MYIFLWVIASTRMFYMLFALLVFVVTVGCIVGIRWGISLVDARLWVGSVRGVFASFFSFSLIV